MIRFSHISRKNIFSEDFSAWNSNNELAFGQSDIAVIYAPNGTGKTSLVEVLGRSSETKYEAIVLGEEVTSDSERNPFHIINDQNGRNIIRGDTQDFILGENIRREYFLKGQIDSGFKDEYSRLSDELKNTFGIKKIGYALKERIGNEQMANFISDIANPKSKGSKIDKVTFVNVLRELGELEVPEFDEQRMRFFIEDVNGQKSVVKEVLGLTAVVRTDDLHKIEENTDAINLLKKYHLLDECVVCDSSINHHDLLQKKIQSRGTRIRNLDEISKKIMDTIISQMDTNDPFEIKKSLLAAIKEGTIDKLNELKESFEEYINIHEVLLYSLLKETLSKERLISYLEEYEQMTQESPQLTDEDVLLIGNFINETIEKEILLERTEENNISLTLSGDEILNKDRTKLSLSNGEQNFISIVFELLRARNSEKEIVVLDDPISSFDSIFKNKIAYSILKILEEKKIIILTHNTDLIQLLEHQRQNCFNLYQLNNTVSEENGLIEVKEAEQELLIYLNKLVRFFREIRPSLVINKREFLIAVIPFMRGYATLTNKNDENIALTSLMHGYNTEQHNISHLFTRVFESSYNFHSVNISAQDIIDIDCNIDLISPDEYPLLNRTLRHLLTYLRLRLLVEKALVDKFNINTNRYRMLTSIIGKAYGGNTDEDKKARIFLLSRKTLLNEFNHFETNMSIFQPAIDITNTMLEKERRDIEGFVARLNE